MVVERKNDVRAAPNNNIQDSFGMKRIGVHVACLNPGRTMQIIDSLQPLNLYKPILMVGEFFKSTHGR